MNIDTEQLERNDIDDENHLDQFVNYIYIDEYS